MVNKRLIFDTDRLHDYDSKISYGMAVEQCNIKTNPKVKDVLLKTTVHL